MDIKNDKLKAIELAMSQIEKQFGKGSIMKLGANSMMDIEVIPTGCLPLDIALGVGGVPNEGISREGNLIDIGVNEEIVQKGGAWFSYKDIRLGQGQGRENSKNYLKASYIFNHILAYLE